MAKRETTLSTKLYFVDVSVDVLFLFYRKLKKPPVDRCLFHYKH